MYDSDRIIISSTIYIFFSKKTVIFTQNIRNRATIKSAPCSTKTTTTEKPRSFQTLMPKIQATKSQGPEGQFVRIRPPPPPSSSSSPFLLYPLFPSFAHSPITPHHHYFSTHENSSCRAATSLFAGRSAKRGDLSVRTKNRWVWVEVCYRKGYVRRVRASLFWCCSLHGVTSPVRMLRFYTCYTGKNIYIHATPNT